MKFSKKHYIVGLVGNLLVLTLALIGIIMLFTENIISKDAFKYFTTLSNMLVALVSFINAILYLVSIINKKSYVKEFFQVLKLISVVSVAITFVIVIIFLAPNNSTTFSLFAGSQLFLHVIVPIAAIVSFIFLEYQVRIRFRFFYLGIFAILLYAAFYIPFAFLAPSGTAVDWYGFLFPVGHRIAPVDPSLFTWGQFFIFAGEAIGASIIFGFLFWLLNKITNLIFIGYRIDPNKEGNEQIIEDEDSKEAVEETKPQKATKSMATTKKASSAPKKPQNNKYKDGARVYHISRSKFVGRSWQVKLANGEKAIKIFPTQLEAINFAKGLAKSQGGSIRIHSMRGQLRK